MGNGGAYANSYTTNLNSNGQVANTYTTNAAYRTTTIEPQKQVTFNSGSNEQRVGVYQTTNYNSSPSYYRNESASYGGTGYGIATSNVTPVHTTYVENRVQPVQTGHYEHHEYRAVAPVVEHRETVTHTHAATEAVGAGVVGAGVATEFGEYARPGYQKLYSTNCYQRNRNVSSAVEEAHKPSKCCGPPCWALLGCLGLLGVILGMLFGLGVIGGLPGFNFGLPSIPIGTSIGDLETDGKPVAVGDIEYPSDSITVQTAIINNT